MYSIVVRASDVRASNKIDQQEKYVYFSSRIACTKWAPTCEGANITQVSILVVTVSRSAPLPHKYLQPISGITSAECKKGCVSYFGPGAPCLFVLFRIRGECVYMEFKSLPQFYNPSMRSAHLVRERMPAYSCILVSMHNMYIYI